MLVMTLRTLTFDAPWRSCTCRTASSTVLPWSRNRSSSQSRAGMVRGSSPRRRLASLAGEPFVERALVPGRDIVGERCLRAARREQGVGHAIGIGARHKPGRDLVGKPTQVHPFRNLNRSLSVERTRVVFSAMMDL
jgi:hypothetical protein